MTYEERQRITEMVAENLLRREEFRQAAKFTGQWFEMAPIDRERILEQYVHYLARVKRSDAYCQSLGRDEVRRIEYTVRVMLRDGLDAWRTDSLSELPEHYREYVQEHLSKKEA